MRDGGEVLRIIRLPKVGDLVEFIQQAGVTSPLTKSGLQKTPDLKNCSKKTSGLQGKNPYVGDLFGRSAKYLD